jgi:hypothetical protein
MTVVSMSNQEFSRLQVLLDVQAGRLRIEDAAQLKLRAEGFEVREEDLARLSPLGFDHINMLGRYAFILPDLVARGELRPLRNPAIVDDES